MKAGGKGQGGKQAQRVKGPTKPGEAAAGEGAQAALGKLARGRVNCWHSC